MALLHLSTSLLVGRVHMKDHLPLRRNSHMILWENLKNNLQRNRKEFTGSRCLNASSSVNDSSSSTTGGRNFSHLRLTSSKIKVGTEELTIVLPVSEDEVLDMHIQEGKLDTDPYWCRLWPSAVLMAQEIFKNPKLVVGKRVCDLGAGLGLPGLAAAMCGAKEVILYDREPLALVCSLLSAHSNIASLRSNLHQYLPDISLPTLENTAGLNKILPGVEEKLSHISFNIPDSVPCNLRQNRSAMEISVSTFTDSPVIEAHVFDWASDSVDPRGFEAILACDVLYESPAVDLIADLVPRLIAPKSGCQLIVTDPLERVPKNRARFVEIMQGKKGDQAKMKLNLMQKRTLLVDDFEYNVVLMVFDK